MNERLTLFQIFLLRLCHRNGGWPTFVQDRGNASCHRLRNRRRAPARTFANIPFLFALLLYAGFALLWVRILSFTPLSRAYPFVALAFALTPLLGAAFFAEPLCPRLLVGIVVIMGGLLLVAG